MLERVLGLWAVTAVAVRGVTRPGRANSTVEAANPVLTSAAVRALTPQAPVSKQDWQRPFAEPPAADEGSAVDPALLAAPRLLNRAGSSGHDPKALLAEAERLAAAGADLTILRAAVPRAVVWGAITTEGAPALLSPVRDGHGRVAGARIAGFPADSFPLVAGLSNGDVITSINGFPISSPELISEAYQTSRRAGMAVAEVIRGRRRVVLAVTWP